MLGVRPDYRGLVIDPCIPREWDGFTMTRVFRGATYHIRVENPSHVEKGVKALYLDAERVESIPVLEAGGTHEVLAVMG